MIDVRLKTFIAICQEGSYTLAAQKLSLTQPAVSQHMRQLENELSAKLFVRKGGKIEVTQEGKIVLKYAKRMSAVYDTMLRALKDEKEGLTRISIGVTPTAESNIMAEVLAEYSIRKPGLRITMITDTITNLYEKLKAYEIDLAIVEGNVPAGSLKSVLLDTDSLVLAVSNENPIAKKSVATLADIKKENMILRSAGSGTRNLFVSHLEALGQSIDDFNVILEVDNIATIKDLVRRNFGVSILARSACMDELKKGKMKALPVENLSMIRQISLVYHEDFDRSDILNDLTGLYYSESASLGSKFR